MRRVSAARCPVREHARFQNLLHERGACPEPMCFLTSQHKDVICAFQTNSIFGLPGAFAQTFVRRERLNPRNKAAKHQ